VRLYNGVSTTDQLSNFDGDQDHQGEDVLRQQGEGEADAVEERVASSAFCDLCTEATVEREPRIRQSDADKINKREPAGRDGEIARVEPAWVMQDGDPPQDPGSNHQGRSFNQGKNHIDASMAFELAVPGS